MKEKCIEKRYFPVFFFTEKDGRTFFSEYGMGHAKMSDAFDEGIRHHFTHGSGSSQGLEIIRENDGYFTRQFDWEVTEKFVWVADKEATAKRYIGE